jgi:glycosyltransferase involved in cell wall biosynthesis
MKFSYGEGLANHTGPSHAFIVGRLMKIKEKIAILTNYPFPCKEPVLDNVFAKELGRLCEIIWFFQGDVSKGRTDKWHNSRLILCREIKGTSWFSKLINRILEWRKFFFLLFFVVFRGTKIVLVRDMPFAALLIAPFRLLFGFKLYYQYTAPLGDIDLGYSEYNKTAKKWWYVLAGYSFNNLIKQTLKTSDLVFPITDFHKKELLCYTHEKKLIPITMGVDEVWLKRKRTEVPYLNEIKKKHFLIAYFGTLGFARKPQFLLKIFAEVKKKCPSSKLILIGKTHKDWEEKELINLCQNLGINNDVIFTGFLDRNILQDHLYYCDVSISPIPPESYYQISSPTKLYESLGNGVPVVANKEIYEQKKVILESGGGVVVDYDTKAFCNAIIHLLKDKKLRKEMANKGRDYVIKNYSYQAIAKKISPYFM